MKKLLYTLAFVVTGFTASYAQKTGRENGRAPIAPEARAERAADALQKKLNLSADQKSKVKQIELDRIKKSNEWREKDRAAMKSKMEERKTFMKANRDKIDAVLTADQKKTLAASRTEMRDNMKDRMKDRKGERGKRGEQRSKRGETPPPPKAVN
jgi:protein CpxP